MSYRNVLIVGLLMAVSAPAFAEDQIFNPWSSFNGYKVYLSPARHSNAGSRGECGTLDGNENTAAYRAAFYAARGFSSEKRGLLSRGYRVRIGRGSVASAIASSNAWGADIHIPIHSNARSERCSNSKASSHGVVAIYKSLGKKGGEGLADQLVKTYTYVTPGSRDFSCHNSSDCTAFNCLGELCRTKAKAAYLEREFHTWDKGAKFMSAKGDVQYSWRIAAAVDRFLGYPRNKNTKPSVRGKNSQ